MNKKYIVALFLCVSIGSWMLGAEPELRKSLKSLIRRATILYGPERVAAITETDEDEKTIRKKLDDLIGGASYCVADVAKDERSRTLVAAMRVVPALDAFPPGILPIIAAYTEEEYAAWAREKKIVLAVSLPHP